MFQPGSSRRLLIAFLFAVLLGCLIAKLHAEDGCDSGDPNSQACYILVERPDACQFLTPWSYWWFFAGCNERITLTVAIPLGSSVVLIPVTVGR